MAVAMRKRRAWSTREDDAESQEAAASEATVAAAKDTAGKCGAFLSTAKSDLTDHQRWLRAQSAAVERDRQRHERWLLRQRNYRLAVARKVRQRSHRRAMRRRAFQAMRHAVRAGVLFAHSWFLFAVARIWAGIAFVGGLARRSLGSEWSVAIAKSSAFAVTSRRVASRGFAAAGRRASALEAAAKRNFASAFPWTKARGGAVMPALYVGMAKFGRQAERYARAGAAHAEGIVARASVPASEAPRGSQAEPEITPVEEKQAAEIYGPFYEGFWVEGVSPNEPRVPEAAPGLVASRGNWENALASLSSWAHGSRASAGVAVTRARVLIASWAAQAKVWADQVQARIRTRDIELSRMMIIAGAVLLVCGGLLLGGGLLLRAGAGTTATDETGGDIEWMFMDTDRPLPERAVFTLSGTPASFRINGLSVGGVNLSGQALTAVEGVLKPDVKRPDLKLTLEVDPQTAPAGEGDAEAAMPADTVPAGGAFRLVFPFPPEARVEEGGITVEEYFESYGGLLLKLRYEIEGTQKSLIQYLPPDTLKAQLDEVSAEADG